MSHDIIYTARARIDDSGDLILEAKAFANNIRPYPNAAERRHRDYCQLAGPLKLTDIFAIREELESLARSYDGGTLKEHFKDLAGDRAYNLWLKRITRVAPELKLPPMRPTEVTYGFGHILRSRAGHNGITKGERLTVERATELVGASVYPKVVIAGLGKRVRFLAFVADGGICVARRRAARRGYVVTHVVADETIPASARQSSLVSSEHSELCIRLRVDGLPDRFLNQWGSAITCLQPWMQLSTFSTPDANEAIARLRKAYPQAEWDVVSTREVPRSDAATA